MTQPAALDERQLHWSNGHSRSLHTLFRALCALCELCAQSCDLHVWLVFLQQLDHALEQTRSVQNLCDGTVALNSEQRAKLLEAEHTGREQQGR